MKKLLRLVIAISLSLCVMGISAEAQNEEGSPPKEIQGEVSRDSDRYVIGCEDVLYIHVWKEEALTREVVVRSDGKISLPLIDEVQAEGLTPLQLKQKLTELLKEFIGSPTVSVTVVEANSSKVFVTGEVKTPGAIRLRGQMTVVQTISLAGGFTDLADQKRVTVIRKEGGLDKRFEINYRDIIAGKNMESNIFLKPGDTLIVLQGHPQEAREEILQKQPKGEVAADSDRYVIGPEDVLYIHVWREESLTRTVPVRIDGNISLPLVNEIRAGGLTPLELREALTEKLKAYIESPIVSVTVTEANSYKVYVSGEVRTPGVYRLRSETSLLQIIPMAGGFTEWANQKKILILRKESGKEKRITVNYKNAVSGEEPGSNVILRAGDTVIVP
jgi:polysaccharide export outer membrane protein